MRYAEARAEKKRCDDAYRFYIASCLKAIATNTSGAERVKVKMNYSEFLNSYGKPAPPQKSGQQIAMETVNALGLKFKE